MAIDFPANPGAQTPVNTFSPTSTPLANTTNSVTFLWDGTKWTAQGSGGGGSSDPVHFEGPTPPTASTLKATDQWFNTDDGRLYTYTLDDVGNLKWVDASPDSQTSLLWERTGTTLEPTNAGDDVDLGMGDLSAASVEISNTSANSKLTFTDTTQSKSGNFSFDNGYLSSNNQTLRLVQGSTLFSNLEFATPGATQTMGFLYDNGFLNVKPSAVDPNSAIVVGPDGTVRIGGGANILGSPNITLNANGVVEANSYFYTYEHFVVRESAFNGWCASIYNDSTASYVASYNNFPLRFGASTGAGLPTQGPALAPNGTAFGTWSDERYKINIEPIVDGLEKVSTLRPVIGRYKTDEEGVRRPFLIAQDVEKVLPEAIDEYKVSDGEVSIALKYTEVIPLLVSALHDAKDRIEALEADNASLEARLTALEGGTN